jgi:hypothetical protein
MDMHASEPNARTEARPSQYRRLMWISVAVALLGLGFLAWADDAITWEGHWTVYTARCVGGHWEAGGHCTGQRVAAERHRFLSQPSRSTIQYEVVGSTSSTSGLLTGCAVQDGRNWNCLMCSTSACPVTRVMLRGEPKLEGPLTDQVRPISKLTWYLLRLMRGG